MGSRKDEPTARLSNDPLYQSLLNQYSNFEFEIVTMKEKQKTYSGAGKGLSGAC